MRFDEKSTALSINFSNFSCMFLNPNIFFQFEFNCSNLLDMRNLQEQVKKAFCYQKLLWPCTVWINCSSNLKLSANSWPSASNFKSFSQLLEHFFLSHRWSEQNTNLIKWVSPHCAFVPHSNFLFKVDSITWIHQSVSFKTILQHHSRKIKL